MDMKKEICGAAPKEFVAGFTRHSSFSGERKRRPQKERLFRTTIMERSSDFREAKTNPFRI